MARKKKSELVVVQDTTPKSSQTSICEGCKHHEHAGNGGSGIDYCNALKRQLTKKPDGLLDTPSDCPLKK